uniref:Uncharacterized protein n=1 Tax=Euplotes harpa TaxID=151035 RepID=A0A7S3JKK9_9SPIT|mmetsp:Transcript_5457/g.6490  ORF Transcript_5457/g.6490 Transcript_5457/m.6490 type:complete len:156 (+) Transcript_5457:116-583(+)
MSQIILQPKDMEDLFRVRSSETPDHHRSTVKLTTKLLDDEFELIEDGYHSNREIKIDEQSKESSRSDISLTSPAPASQNKNDKWKMTLASKNGNQQKDTQQDKASDDSFGVFDNKPSASPDKDKDSDEFQNSEEFQDSDDKSGEGEGEGEASDDN